MTGKELLDYLNSLSQDELNSEIFMPHRTSLYSQRLRAISCTEAELVDDRRIRCRSRERLINQHLPTSKKESIGKRIFLFD